MSLKSVSSNALSEPRTPFAYLQARGLVHMFFWPRFSWFTLLSWFFFKECTSRGEAAKLGESEILTDKPFRGQCFSSILALHWLQRLTIVLFPLADCGKLRNFVTRLSLGIGLVATTDVHRDKPYSFNWCHHMSNVRKFDELRYELTPFIILCVSVHVYL